MSALQNFHDEVVDIYGYFLQVSAAIMLWHKFLNDQIAEGSTTRQNTFFFGRGDPNKPDSTYQYRRSYAELIDVSANGGTTSVIHRRSVVVLLVTSWEDRHRALIARDCGLNKKDDLKSDVFYDLNKCRQAIVHAGGSLRKSPKAIRLFRRGDALDLTDDHIHMMFRIAVEELNRLGVDYYGTNPGFTFDKSMRAT